MKTFKRALSGFLALLMIFSTFSVLSMAADQTDGNSVTFKTDFYAQNADGVWEKVTKVKAGTTVKARVSIETDFLIGASAIFWVYSKDFMTLDTSVLNCTETNERGDTYDSTGIIPSGSVPETNNWGVFFVHSEDVAEYSLADDMIYEGYFDNIDGYVDGYEYFEDKGWITLYVDEGTPAMGPSDSYMFEFTFNVKSNPTADEGFFYVPEGSVQNTSDRGYALTAVQRASSGAASGFVPKVNEQAYLYDYSVTLSDTNTIALYTETGTTYTQNVYTMDTDGNYGAAVKTTEDAEIGAKIESSAYAVPTGFTLDTVNSTASVIATDDGAAVMNIYLKRNQYTVTFGDTTETLYYGETITAPTDPVKPGYTFDGWYNGNDKLEADDTVPAENVTYTAKFTPASGVTYTVKKYFMNTDGATYADPVSETLTGTTEAVVSYATQVEGFTLNTAMGKLAGTVAGDGSLVLEAYYDRNKVNVTVDGEKEEMFYGEEIAKPADPTPETGYEFDKWVDGTDNEITEWPVTVGTSDVIIKPVYKAIERTITYVYAGEVPEGLTAPAAKTGIIGDAVVIPAVPTAEGYTATAWVVEGADADGKVYDKDVTVTTTWAINSYTVTFYADEEGKVVHESKPYKYGETFAYPATNPTKPGAQFEAWDTAIGDVEGDMEIYPIFTNDVYTIKFIGLYNTEIDSYPANYGDVINTLPSEDEMAEDGYKFNGWKVDGEVATAPITVTGSMTFVADYEALPATITFNAAGGKFANGDTTYVVNTYYDAEITEDMIPADPTREGYEFNVWDTDLVGSIVGELEITVNAQWNIKSYTVKFVADGKDILTETLNYGAAITAPAAPEKEGYTFDGWFNGDVEYATTDTVPAADVTYTAKYTANDGVKYTVKKYFMNTDGATYANAEEEILYAVAGEEVSYNATVEGFTINNGKSVLSGTVAGNGSLVLEVYYDRDAVKVTIDGTTEDKFYGEEIPEPTVTPDEGYELDKWVDENGDEVTFPVKVGTEDIVIEPVFKAIERTITYVYAGDVPAGLTAPEATTGIIGDEVVIPAVPTAEGYTASAWVVAGADAEGKVATSDVTVTTTWTINKYAVKFIVDGTAVYDEELAYGATIVAPADPAKAGYTFDGWFNGDVEYTADDKVGTAEVTYTAKFTADTDVKYTVKKYFMVADGSAYAAPEEEILEGTADATVSYNTTVEGFTINNGKGKLSGTVAGDGSLVLEVYYDRDTVKVTIDGVEEDKYYGSEIAKPADPTPEAGYEFDKWVDENGDEVTFPVKVGTEDIVIKPVYTAIERTITYVYAGDVPAGLTAPDAATGIIGDTVVIPAVPTAEGYTASAWVVAGADADGKVATSDVTVTTTWTINKYAVKFIVDGTAVYDEELAYGSSIVAPADPAKAGYTFDGWFNGDVEYTADDKVGTAEVTYTAKFTADTDVKYTVKKYFMVVDGSAYAAPEEEILEGTADATVSYNTTVEGFTINNGKSKLSGTVAGDGSLVLEVYYDRDTVKVTIDGVEEDKYYGSEIAKPADPTPEAGYEFDKWVDENGDEVTFPVKVGTEDIVIKPVYTAIERTITYVYAGDVPAGLTAPEAATGIIGDAVVIPAVPTAEGYTASAWVVAGADAEGKVATSDVTVTTTWTINKFAVTFYADEAGTKVHATKEYAYGETIAYPDSDPAKEGHTFAAWNVAEGTEVKSAIEVYPSFTINSYSLTFEIDGVTETIVVEYGSAVTAPEAPDKSAEGKTFVGWYDKETNTKMPATMPAKDATYVPVYSDNDTAQYAIKVYIMDTEGNYTLSATTYHTAAAGSIQSVTPGEWVGCTVDNAKSVLTATVSALGDTVLEVYYARNIYTVTFDGAAPIEVYYGAAVPTVEPVAQPGKVFTGWTPAIPATMPAENLEFTSTWEAATYKVTYLVNGQATEVGYAYNDTVEAPANPALAGMKFKGWVDTNGNDVVFPFAMPANDLTITAKFETAFYTVSYIADGEVFAAYSVSYGGQVPVPESAPVKEFHTFDGWTAIPGKMPAHDVEVQAIFTPVPVRLVAAPGSTTVIDRDNMVIYGLDIMLTDEIIDELYLDVEGDGTLVITGVTSTRFGTGTKVEVIDNNTGNVVETFYIVVFGDVNGDSIANSADVSIVRSEAYYITDWSFETEYVDGVEVDNADYNALWAMAGDLNGDGRIDATDVSLVSNAVLGMVAIDQVEGNVVRS